MPVPENIWPLVIVDMQTSAVPPFCSWLPNRTWNEILQTIVEYKLKPGISWICEVPKPRSTKNSFFSSEVPGGPSKKFSGFTSPWTYLTFPKILADINMSICFTQETAHWQNVYSLEYCTLRFSSFSASFINLFGVGEKAIVLKQKSSAMEQTKRNQKPATEYQNSEQRQWKSGYFPHSCFLFYVACFIYEDLYLRTTACSPPQPNKLIK